MKTEVAGATDSDSGYLVRSSVDPADNQARLLATRDHILGSTQALVTKFIENGDLACKEYLKYSSGVWARSLDHFGCLPPVSTTSSTPIPKVA